MEGKSSKFKIIICIVLILIIVAVVVIIVKNKKETNIDDNSANSEINGIVIKETENLSDEMLNEFSGRESEEL